MYNILFFGMSKIFNFAEIIIPSVPSEPIIILWEFFSDVIFFI